MNLTYVAQLTTAGLILSNRFKGKDSAFEPAVKVVQRLRKLHDLILKSGLN